MYVIEAAPPTFESEVVTLSYQLGLLLVLPLPTPRCSYTLSPITTSPLQLQYSKSRHSNLPVLTAADKLNVPPFLLLPHPHTHLPMPLFLRHQSGFMDYDAVSVQCYSIPLKDHRKSTNIAKITFGRQDPSFMFIVAANSSLLDHISLHPVNAIDNMHELIPSHSYHTIIRITV